MTDTPASTPPTDAVGSTGAPPPPPGAGAPHDGSAPAGAGSGPAATGGGAASPAALDIVDCPVCGTANAPGASFCEACGSDLTAAPVTAPTLAPPGTVPASPAARDAAAAAAGAAGVGAPGGSAPAGSPDGLRTATPQTAPAGEESPLDVGWTGPVPAAPAPVDDDRCTACGQGRIVDGYCDHCGSPPPDPRDHFTEAPAAWVAGVCDIGRRHSRNEDAMALSAREPAGSRAVLVVCDGVSMATDSHIASLAAAKAARTVLDQPFPRGAGTPEAWSATAARALTAAVEQANDAVVDAVQTDVPNPPSCTFAAAVVEDGVVVAGNVGDSRVYWLPDAADEPARQLGRDDSFAQEQIISGVPRVDAENGPHAHSITRWLGKDAPDDLTPHLTSFTPSAGWLVVCSDGLWNYCSEAEDVRRLVHDTASALGDGALASGPQPLAQALVDFANGQGGRDNITVALARLAGQGSNQSSAAPADAAPEEGAPIDG